MRNIGDTAIIAHLPTGHSRSQGTGLSNSADTASHRDELLYTSNVHLACSDITFAKLPHVTRQRLRMCQLDVVIALTSIAARVITEFIVPSCTANEGSWTLRRSSATESAMSISDVWNPLWASSSSSRHAVCRETWNKAGSPKARGHHEMRKGLEVALRSSG